MSWAGDALAALDRGTPTALLTIVTASGSVPRGAGTRMVVTAETAFGTIGGGNLEYRAIDQARRILGQPPGTARVQDYPLGPLLGQCCGGRVRLHVEHLQPGDRDRLADADDTRRPVVMIGAGHVGTAIARVLDGTPVALDWCDTRADYALGGARLIDAADAVERLAHAAADEAVVVLTHDHGLDYRLVAAALGGAARFVGLIGSATKRARFVARLRRDGIDPARLVCPIGIASVVGKEPAVIAVAVAAQLLALPALPALPELPGPAR